MKSLFETFSIILLFIVLVGLLLSAITSCRPEPDNYSLSTEQF